MTSEELLRGYLPFPGAGQPLQADINLRLSALDSPAAAQLPGPLESLDATRFADEAFSLDTFAPPASLWGTVTRLKTAA
ncbi:acyl carrier protein [Streptomyces sp. NPDC005907]|uniref:acyl carrier protein n=1 Tax=Streptomyces sp. NPDC005907 TaxID=3154571 RepID=UPI0033FB06DC